MPYITPHQRDALDPVIHLLVKALRAMHGDPPMVNIAGSINYAFTRVLLETILDDPNYTRIALTTGVLENIKQEMYRRLAAPYEDTKIAENGDVYE